MFRAVDIIAKKQQKIALSKAEIDFFFNAYNLKKIADYQMSAFLMACFFQGLTEKEIFYITDCMIKSGDQIDFPWKEDFIVDKHSTGGVGDKVTLALGPLVSSFGITMAKMSGRGLGHTGGTLDKLESIPDFSINLSKEKFIEQIKAIHFAVIGQTDKIVPLDKKIYALRDVTSTVNVLGLIASSIMSKKLAVHSDLIVLDVKCGNGAFMQSHSEATQLAKLMLKIAKHYHRKAIAVITDMSQPLGNAIGNKIEVYEAMDTLNNLKDNDFANLVKELTAIILVAANKTKNHNDAQILVEKHLEDKLAIDQFRQFVKYQHGDIEKLEWKPKYQNTIYAQKKGYLQIKSALIFGQVAMKLGAGRLTYEEKIDYDAGIILHKKSNNYIRENDKLFTLYSNQEITNDLIKELDQAFIIQSKIDKKTLIYQTIYQE